MYRKTLAALGGLCIDTAALVTSSVTETGEIITGGVCVAAKYTYVGAAAAHNACSTATGRIADLRVSRKQRLQAWAIEEERNKAAEAEAALA